MFAKLFAPSKSAATAAPAGSTSKARGDASEAMAASYLCAKGLSLVTQNYHCRFGEIDLIMREREVLVFIEVRYRKDGNFGGAIESIHHRKQTRLIAAANVYLSSLSNPPACRFDVVLHDANNRIEWIRDAFQADS